MLKLPNARFHEPLRVFSGMVFSVLGEVAHLTGSQQTRACVLPAGSSELFQLFSESVESLLFHDHLLGVIHFSRILPMDPLERTEQCLERIEATDSQLKAWVLVDADGAREQARRAKGPLSGMPVAIKDVIDVAGWPTRASSRVLADNIAEEDAPVVVALRKAGAVILGKTNTHEFAYGYATEPTCNPWDLNRIPGGSSGGSAAAVAAGQCVGALGTDTGGSVRVPAALCGVCGLKPRPGIVPTEGVIPLVPAFDVVGPIASTVLDLTALWTVLSGRVPEAVMRPRVGIPSLDVYTDLEGEVESRYLEAVEVLKTLSASVEAVTIPRFEDFDKPRQAMVMPAVLEVHRSKGWWPDKANLYSGQTRRALEYAENEMPPGDVQEGRLEAARLVDLFLSAFTGVDVIVTPTVPCVAPTHDEATYTPEGSGRPSISSKLGRIPSVVNLAGLAAVSIPCGFAEGLPVGLHLIGKDESTVLSLAAAYQLVTSWHTARPSSFLDYRR